MSNLSFLSVRWQRSGSFGFAKGRLVCRAKPNVPFAGWLKIVFKKCGREKNKKHRVGNECRLTRCPFVISFLCLWSPVKMVYFFLVLSRLFDVVESSFTLAANGGGMASKGLRAISCQVTRNVEAGYNPSHTSETLIGYTAC